MQDNINTNVKVQQMQDNLENLGIYQLRNLARQVGVSLPTTLKKAELIEKIIAIVSGEQQPKFRKDKKGRPAKYPADASLLTTISNVNQEEAFSTKSYHTISRPTLASFEAIKLQDIQSMPSHQKQGYVSIGADGYALFLDFPQKSSEPFYIKRQMVLDCNLKDGDRVTVNVVTNNSTCIVSSILSVNGEENFMARKLYDFSSCEKSNTKQSLWGENGDKLSNFYSTLVPAYLGDKVLIDIPQKELLYACNLEFIKNLSQNERITDIVVLGVNCSEEAFFALSEIKKVNLIAGKFGEDEEYQRFLVQTAFKNALNLANTQGKNVAFVVLDFAQMLSVFSDTEQKDLITYTKKFFTFARSTQNSSLTICYAFASCEQLLNTFTPNQNVLLQFLPLKYLTKSKIKYNLVNSFRQEVVLPSESGLALKQAVENFLNKNDNDYSLLEEHIQKNTSITTLAKELDV